MAYFATTPTLPEQYKSGALGNVHFKWDCYFMLTLSKNINLQANI